jgi:ABC-type bacteriocin/lantibiotic exporter with double-glycine peptidase domain
MLLNGQITAGTLVLFLAVSSGLVAALTAMHFQIEQLQEAAAAHARMATVTAGVPEDLAESAPAPASGPIAIRDLGFSHAGSSDTLDGLDLAIAAHEHLAIIGRSGEGKTTLAQLLARLHAPDRGSILLDGTAAQDLPLDAYRRCVVLVPHATQIFSASLRDNVRLWNAAVSDAEVDAALARAGLDIDPETLVGERGNPLSAGQRQRVGLARVFLRRPAVLILDEATSALDAESEAAVLHNIREMMFGRILIVITHRAQVAAGFDRIVRIKGGRVSADDRRVARRAG